MISSKKIHREHFLLHCLKQEIATAKELDLRPLGKVIIFRDRQTNRTFLLYIDILFNYDHCLLRWGNILRDLVLTDHGDALG